DGKLSPQDACSGACTNYMYGTVRNVGCRANPETLPEMSVPAQLKFYWSMGGTRQIWPGNWTTDMYAPGLPQGLQIATIPIPVLNPGQKTQLNANWTAPNPTTYFPGTNSMLTC